MGISNTRKSQTAPEWEKATAQSLGETLGGNIRKFNRCSQKK
jgi:hypothetical protein